MAVYALSDIHGFKTIYDQVKKQLLPEDKVIFLGDAADRGPHGWQCMTAILDDPQFLYILGNHDLLLIRTFLGPDKYRNREMWNINGGDKTHVSMKGITSEERDEYLHKLQKCAYYFSYINPTGQKIFLSHSGGKTTADLTDPIESGDFTWDRSHFLKKAPEDVDLIVHGHTPIRYLISELNDYSEILEEKPGYESDAEFVPGKPFYYAGYTKCDIDNGTVQTGVATLLNLDTLESIPIWVDGEEKDFLWK